MKYETEHFNIDIFIYQKHADGTITEKSTGHVSDFYWKKDYNELLLDKMEHGAEELRDVIKKEYLRAFGYEI